MSDIDEIDATLTIESQAGPATLLSVHGREGIGRPFEYEVTFRCADVNPDQARGTLAILDLDGTRFVTGIVQSLRVEVLPAERANDAPRYTARLWPEPYFRLRHRRGYRIFQEQTVVEIAQEVLTAAGVPSDQVDWAGVSGSYPTRTYTVQYDETEWDFISRLFEEEGIYYAFTHDAAGHRMIVMDANNAAERLDPESLPYLSSGPDTLEIPGVWDWREHARIRESKVTLRDYDFEHPSLDLTAEASETDAIDREHYAYPGYYTLPAEGARLARVRLDAFRSARLTARCFTNVLDILPGKRFELTDHEVFSGDRLVTSVRVDIDFPDSRGLPGEGPRRRVDVEVTTQPFEQQFRSLRRTAKPKVMGVHTAMVAGPAGEEIHVDRYGRVKVQFHWDRQGQGDEHASCWMRVTQQHTTGSIMIPRIGWEVLVEFVDGDPDRPLVLGRLWNPNTFPPHPLPASKTFTVHASVSSPGRGGTNEIVMDDAAGSEKVTVNAQHDYTLAVANDRMLNVGMNFATTVTGSRTATISGNEKRGIKGNQGDSVTGSHTISVSGTRGVKVTGSTTEEVKGAMSFTAGSENVQVGSPAAAVLEAITNAAVNAAAGAAANAASRAEAAMMGPLMPGLAGARGALGGAAQLTGPAAALFGPSPSIPAVSAAAARTPAAGGQGAPAPAGAPGASGMASTPSAPMPTSPAALASGLAAAAASSVLGDAVRAASGGGGGGGGGGGPTGAAGGTGGGSGTWGVTVGGAVTESVGGVAAYNSASGIAITIGGSNKETVGAARIEMIRGGKSESTGAAKLETVGVYVVKSDKSYGVDAMAAIALNIAGAQSNDISGGHSIAAKGPVVVTTPSAKLEASGKITLACGACKVVVASGGIEIQGASAVTIEGSTIELPETSLGT